MKNLILLIFSMIIGHFIAGCSPNINTMQTARMLKPNTIEIIPNYATLAQVEDDYWKQNNFGGCIGIGLTEKTSLYGLYNSISYGPIDDKDFWGSVHAVGLGPKFQMTTPEENKTLAALYIPVGTAFGKSGDNFRYIQIQPTMTLTHPINEQVDFLSSTSLIITKYKGQDIQPFTSQNIGLDLFLNKEFSFRPEIGFCVGSGAEVTYMVSIGFSWAPSGFRD